MSRTLVPSIPSRTGVPACAANGEWRFHAEAERISNARNWRERQTAFDILHVATALTAGAKVLLTFDSEQAALAKAEGLKAKP